MKTLNEIYKNQLGACYSIQDTLSNDYHLALEINQVSFLINKTELNAFINSTQTIIEHHKDCTCPKDLPNKMVIYQAKQTEIRMLLSFSDLFLLKELLEGSEFQLSMSTILSSLKIL